MLYEREGRKSPVCVYERDTHTHRETEREGKRKSKRETTKIETGKEREKGYVCPSCSWKNWTGG
jgi:hypothetical protein